jgi:hypothetical protein
MQRNPHILDDASAVRLAITRRPLAQRTSPMTTHDRSLAAEVLAAGEPAGTLSSWIRRLGRRIVTWVEICADYYAAAAMYEQLSALSDAELARRGLSRATLAHDVCVTCDRNPTTAA